MERDRRLRRDERPTLRVALVWLGLCAIMLAVAWPRVIAGQFPDPDDVLRLVQVRDLLAGQGWFDTVQHRIDPPQGTPMHWSRLVDVPLALTIGLLTPLVGQGAAETFALVAVPLLTFGATLWVVGRLAWRLLGPRTAIYACLACGFLPALLFQFQPMRIDHHGWQVFTVALALWALSWRDAVKGGAVAGLAMAAGLSISVELLPMAAAFGAVLAWRWLGDRHRRWWLVAYLQTLALALVAFYAATRGISDLGQRCDAISPAQLGFFLVVALGVGAIGWASSATRIGLAALLALAGLAGIGFVALAAPACLAPPFAGLDPLVRDYWYLNVGEGRPLWHQGAAHAIPALIQMGVALAATLALRARSFEWMRRWWSEYAVLLACAVVLSLFVARSLAFASVIACIPLGWLAGRLFARLRSDRAPLAKVAVAVAIVVLLVPAAPVTLAARLPRQVETVAASRVSEANCRIGDSARLLARLPRGTVFAPFDIGPAILLETNHAVVATGHHRAEAAMADVIRAFTLPEAKARAIVAAHGADYLALCTDMAEPALYAERHPEGLGAALVAGNPPHWLERISLAGPPEFAVYRVVR